MMSGYYDQHHRWEPLAEFHFNIDSDEDELFDENNYIYCLCSRVCIRDGVRRHVEKEEEGSESDVEVLRDSQYQEWEDESHVHFSVDTSDKVKCEKDEGASCYCSASHTDNYCSTDEHDPAQHHLSHALQPSDSGADLTYPDCLSDNYKLEKMDQDYPLTETNENYLSENTWDKFWATNGERLIWASWIKKYSDYINPNYLDENNELSMDEQSIPKQHSADAVFEKETDRFKKNEEESMRDRKFSYDSKVNPYKKKKSNLPAEKNDKNVEGNKDDIWLPIGRRRSCSENERMLSPRTMAGTDSMTNVTKITLSSYDVTSSHVTSESTPTDDYSVSSSTSDDQSNDQTRIANIIDDNLDQPLSEEIDTEQYWQFLWKKHFGEQYALHYANYLESHTEVLPENNIENQTKLTEKKIEEKLLDIDCENSEGNSQETPTVIEVQAQVDKIKLDDKVSKPKKRNKKSSSRYLGSVGVLLQNLLKEEQKKNQDEASEVDATEGNDQNQNESTNPSQNDCITADSVDGMIAPTAQNDIYNRLNKDKGDEDDEPPEERTVSLKRSHEIDEDTEDTSEIIKETFETMGFCVKPENIPGGVLVHKARVARLRPPRGRRYVAPRKTYFDDDGNPCEMDQGQESHDEREMPTDDECPAKSDPEKDRDVPNSVEDVLTTAASLAEAASVALPEDPDDPVESVKADEVPVTAVASSESTKRRRRQKRHAKADDVTDMPIELQGNPKMLKYWKKRHSLFHRFDEGIKLDYESWFSVTPENVARHIADKLRYDVLLDAFCGAGGNTIQFARTCKKVIAVDIDPEKIALARHNAEVYGIADRVEFIVGDFFELAPTLKADAVFLSPPWGGPSYSENEEYDIETMLEPRPASALLEAARAVSGHVAVYLPRNTRTDQILSLAKEAGGSVEVEQSYLDRRFVAITAYFY